MENRIRVNNVIIHEGDKTYSNAEVQESERLSFAVHRVILGGIGLIDLYERINRENGELHLTIDSSDKVGVLDLKGVSYELYRDFLNR